MKPLLVEMESENGARIAWLVDDDSIFVSKDASGVSRIHYGTAISISDKRAGEMPRVFKLIPVSKATWICRADIWLPRPCVFAKKGADFRDNNPMSRGIRSDAAMVLLSLAQSANDILNRPGRDWFFDGPVEKGADHPWDLMKFIVAWCWSDWMNKGFNGKERHAAALALGYEGNEAAFRKLCSRMGLRAKIGL